MSRQLPLPLRILLRSTFVWTVGVLGLASATAGCGSSPSQARTPVVYPAYDAEGKHLFGDTIDAAAVGLELSGQPVSKRDVVFGDRTQAADWVAKVRIATVTARDKTAGGEHFDVTLRMLERLTGTKPTVESVVLRVEPHDESYGIVRSLGERLVGRDFLGFFRVYRGSDGDPVVHFHLTSDSQELEDAVRGAVLTNELR